MKGVSSLSFQRPSHKASVFDVLICKPEIEANFSSLINKCDIESRSRTITVVSSAYIDMFISLSPVVIPLIRLSRLMALARSSRPITNNKPDSGQPCLTPRFIGKKHEACPLFKTQLEMSACRAQLVEHRTGIVEVTGSNPVEALIFFQASSFQLLKLEIYIHTYIFINPLSEKHYYYYCDDHSLISSLPALQI